MFQQRRTHGIRIALLVVWGLVVGIGTTVSSAAPSMAESSMTTVPIGEKTQAPSEVAGTKALSDVSSAKRSDASVANRAEATAITPFAVPTPTGNNAVITVKTGGIRSTLTSVSGASGVTLKLYDGTSSAPNANPRTESWATCISDAQGDCNFTIPTTQTGGANRDAQFWIKQANPAAPGYFTNNTLAVGGTTASAQYQFRTGPQLRNGVTYASTADFMIASGNTNNSASGGIWQNSLANPALPQQCGLDVALVLDLSGSVSPFISNLRSAAKGFVDSLTGTPSQVSLFTFSNVAPAGTGANLPLSSVSTASGATTVKNRIDTYTAASNTNWDRGLYQVASTGPIFDVAVVITDGDPTVYANAEGPGNRTRFREVENGVFSANAIKNQGTRVVAVGVGAGVAGAPDNLRAISGPTLNSDYYQSADYASATQSLRALALGNCTGSISVVKEQVNSNNTGEGIVGATPVGGWNFTATTSSTGVTPTSQSGVTDNATGAVNFPLDYAGGATSGTVAIAETQQSGYILVTQAGKRAVCTNVATGAAVTVTNDPLSSTGFLVDAPSSAAISCKVYNRPPQPQASIAVSKQWVVNGTSYTEGNQPLGLDAQLTLAGSNQVWSAPRTGLTAGNTIAINESPNFVGRDLCTLDSSRITQQNGATVDLALPYTATLAAGDANNYTITNTVTCTSQLTLAKQVQGGTQPANSWTLSAVAPPSALAGPTGISGSAGATAAVTPNVRYPLVETGGNPLYVQKIQQGGVPIAPSIGSWDCVQTDAAGNPIAGFADGINGGVTVPLGFRVKCTAINQTASLNLVKQVVNNNGNNKVAADWTLTATPTGTPIPGVDAQQVAGSTAGNTITVRPGTTYSLTEAGPGGYTQSSLRCDTGPNGTYVDTTTITPSALSTNTCVFVNDDVGANLTLVKQVDNGATGSAQVASSWTLSAAGPTPISGASGSGTITNANVNVGAYTLSEAGPAGYTASAWSCDGGVLAGTTLTLSGGNNVTCTITNTAQQPKLTLVKSVQNGSTGGTAVPSDWTLTATGPNLISGTGNSPQVTAQNAQVGTYALSESGGPVGYSASNWVCVGGASSTGSSVTLALGSDATCTITNTAVSPSLTLSKQVVNSSGGSASVADWTLQFQGPATGSGVTGSAAVSNATVPAGSYALSETGGPSGYSPSAWTCTGGTVTGSSVQVGLGANVECTITNTDQPASLTLIKTVSGGDSGTTKVPADWTLTATPSEISGQAAVTGNGTGVSADGGVQSASVFSGSYTLSEDGPSGFDQGNWVCQGGVVNGDVVTLPPGGNVICTITNTAQTPTLTLVKTVNNGDGLGTESATSWTLSAVGETPISGATGSATVTNARVAVGEYLLSESGPGGYTPSEWSCDGGTQDGSSITLSEGQNVTCTITNAAVAPRLTLTKVVDNGVTGATAVASDWTLTAKPAGAFADITGTSGSPVITDAAAHATTYTLTEANGPSGYIASQWVCVGGTESTGSTIRLQAGDSANCTITNTAVAPKITLKKIVDNGETGATATVAAWTLSAEGSVNISGVTDAPAVTSAEVPVGLYSLGENGPLGYDASNWSCPGKVVLAGIVILGPGDDVTCTITNTAISSTLTLVKTVVNDDGGASVPADWTLNAGAVISGTSGVTGDIPVGSYPLSETGPAGYELSSLVCSTDNSTGIGSPAVNVGLGQDITCTFTNTDIAPTLTLVKTVEDNGSNANNSPNDWTLSASPNSIPSQPVVSGPGGVAAVSVHAGTYELGETGPGGYDASAWDCVVDGGASLDNTTLDLPVGSHATCSLTNTAKTPTITLVKDVVNDQGGKLPADQFPLQATNGATVVSGVTATPAVTEVAVPVGTYTLTETNPDIIGYGLDSLSCVNGTTPLPTNIADPTVNLSLGSAVTCTYTNEDKPAKLTLIKDVAQNNTGTTKQPKDWDLKAEPQSIGGQSEVTGNGTGVTADGGVQEVTVFAGKYLLSETGPSGFDSGAWVCEGGAVSGQEVVVPNGGNVICTITNTATSPKLTLVKVVDNGTTSGTSTPADWTLSANGPTPVSGITGGASITDAAVHVGSYTLAESGTPVGYTASSWVCDGGNLADNVITLAEGEDVSCAITNTAIPSTWTVSKTSDPPTGSTVSAGGSITYTVTATHTGGVLPTPVTVTDNLADVLNNATILGSPVTTAGTASVSGTDLVWSIGTLSGTQTMNYTVKVNDEANGVMLRNVVTPPPGSTCSGSCETTHVTPAWLLTKESDPASGSLVKPNSTVTYTLRALNTSGAVVSGATAIDDLSEVLNNAALVQPLAPGLSYDSSTKKLTWSLPTLAPGSAEVSVSYTVTVAANAMGKTLANVVTPNGSGGSCPAEQETGCDTNHKVKSVDLAVSISHLPILGVVSDETSNSITATGGAVEVGRGDTITYKLGVVNNGPDDTKNVVVTDALVPGLTYMPGTVTAPPGWVADVQNGLFKATFAGVFNVGDSGEFYYTVRVDSIPGGVGAADAVIPSTVCETNDEIETDYTNNCATDYTPVKTIAVQANAVCVNDAPYMSYTFTPYNVSAAPTVALIWWTQEAYNARDVTIPASDTAAILANGASQVDLIPTPQGWTSGQPISGQTLWPGGKVDAQGKGIGWPGWTETSPGKWVLDPSAPFYNLRGSAVAEIRINPSTASTLVYPPATPNCNAAPPGTDPPESGPKTGPKMAVTGSETGGLLGLTGVLLGLGVIAMVVRRRRNRA